MVNLIESAWMTVVKPINVGCLTQIGVPNHARTGARLGTPINLLLT